MACDICQGKKHIFKIVKDKSGDERKVWARCDCLREVLKKQALEAAGNLASVDPYEFDYDDWDKQNWMLCSDIPFARRIMAYLFSRNLAHRYKFILAYDLVEIYFLSSNDKDNKDKTKLAVTSEHRTIEDLLPYDVLAIGLGYGELPNKLLPSLITQVFQMRDIRGSKPTILVTPFKPEKIASKYNNDRLNDLVEGLPKVSVSTEE